MRPQDHDRPDATVALTAAGVSVLIDAGGGRLPAIVHWGHELPALDAEQAAALVAASVPVIGSNNVELAPRVAVLPEQHTGWSGRPGLSGSFAGRTWSPAFTTRSVSLDGGAVSGFRSSGPGAVEVLAVDDTGRLQLRLTLELLACGLFRARASVTNLAAEPYSVEQVVVSFPVPAEAAEILDFAGRHTLERVPQRKPFRTGAAVRENRKGRTGVDSAYVLHVGTPGFGFAHGSVWAVHTAWSGNHVHYAERAFTGEQLIGGGELLLPGEMRLNTGETYQSPWVYGSYGVGLDDVAHRFHRYLRNREPAVSADRPVSLNVWEAVYFDHDLERLVELAERAAAVGVERYVLDDGWFGSRRHERAGLGDWTVSPEVWPQGLHPLVERVKGLGLQFGLWIEPEMVSPDSDLARAHPDWIMAARADWPVESRHQQVLNLGIPEAYEHVKTQILAVLKEYPIDYLKWDHNRDLVEAGTQADGGRPGVHAQTLAFYRLLDETRAAHPRLEVESCSSGGGRVDLGVLERTDRVWLSDNIDPHDRQTTLRWTTQLIPPEFMGRTRLRPLPHHRPPPRPRVPRRHGDLRPPRDRVGPHQGHRPRAGRAGRLDPLLQAGAGPAAAGRSRPDGQPRPDPVRLRRRRPGPVPGDLRGRVDRQPVPDPPARLKLRGLDPDRRYRLGPCWSARSPPASSHPCGGDGRSR